VTHKLHACVDRDARYLVRGVSETWKSLPKGENAYEREVMGVENDDCIGGGVQLARNEEDWEEQAGTDTQGGAGFAGEET